MNNLKNHHNKDGSFKNNHPIEMTHRSLKSVMKWKLLESLPKRQSIHHIECDLNKFRNTNESLISWIGHATFLIKHNGLTILTDPHFSKRASPFQWIGPKRTTPPSAQVNHLPNIDIVLISHDHYDHLDKASVLKIHEQQKSNPPLFALPLGLGKWFKKRGINNWIELDWWESHHIDGWEFTSVPAQHFSGRSLRQDRTLWCGWVARSTVDDRKFYFAGDTGYSPDFKAIGDHFNGFDVSMLPIGAYEPQWFMKHIHASPEDAVRMHMDVQSKFSLSMHWGAFMLTNEPMLQPPHKLKQALLKHKVKTNDFVSQDQGAILSLFQ
jgi:L-ascorbate metabolism protein UlaG (beta-lactamase superfamily)